MERTIYVYELVYVYTYIYFFWAWKSKYHKDEASMFVYVYAVMIHPIFLKYTCFRGFISPSTIPSTEIFYLKWSHNRTEMKTLPNMVGRAEFCELVPSPIFNAWVCLDCMVSLCGNKLKVHEGSNALLLSMFKNLTFWDIGCLVGITPEIGLQQGCPHLEYIKHLWEVCGRNSVMVVLIFIIISI